MTDDEKARLVVGVSKAVALKERRRIRRLVAPHLHALLAEAAGLSWYDKTAVRIRAIDRAIRAPRKARKGK